MMIGEYEVVIGFRLREHLQNLKALMQDLGIERNKGGSYKIYVKSKVIGESVTVSRYYA